MKKSVAKFSTSKSPRKIETKWLNKKEPFWRIKQSGLWGFKAMGTWAQVLEQLQGVPRIRNV